MLSFNIGIKNLPAEANYWKIFYCYEEEVCTPSSYPEAPFLSPSATSTFSVSENLNHGYFVWAAYTSPGYYISDGYGRSNWYTIKNGANYQIDFATGTVAEITGPGITIEVPSFELLLPMPPNMGPPLPRIMGIYWPWYEGEPIGG